MKTLNNFKIIGIDHGYGNIKTANHCFKTGITTHDSDPLFTKDMLTYNGKYYLIGEGHKEFLPEKQNDEDYYILTLAAISTELSDEGLTEADVIIAEQEGTSKDTVKRYIRLTKLIPDILKMVDEQRIAFSVGVELSYLTEYEQQDLFEAIELEDKTPSLSQAIQMKKLSQSGKLDSDTISKIISEEKPNQREKISFQIEKLTKFFPKSYTPRDIERKIIKLIEDDYRSHQRNKNRDER